MEAIFSLLILAAVCYIRESLSIDGDFPCIVYLILSSSFLEMMAASTGLPSSVVYLIALISRIALGDSWPNYDGLLA